MRVRIDTDERYPTYYLRSAQAEYGYEVEVDGATLRRWRRVLDAYDKVQDEMAVLHDPAEEAARLAARERAVQERSQRAAGPVFGIVGPN